MITARALLAASLTLGSTGSPVLAQQSNVVTSGPIVIQEFKHDSGPLLREIVPLLPEYTTPSEHALENPVNPKRSHWSSEYRPDPVLQSAWNSPAAQTPPAMLEFDGLGFGDQFFCNCSPPDNDGAPGSTQYMQFVNLFFAVYDKQGNPLMGPLPGNSFWSGFSGPCETENDGDPIVRYDAAAQRWVVSQLDAFNKFYECVAVAQPSDATGAYYRYAFHFKDFSDYPKLSVWPDAYYMTFNEYNALLKFIGAMACAADRNAMLAGNTASIVCFQQNSSQWSELPADLDGPTPPAPDTPNFVMELDPSGSANLDLFQFHVDFVTPTNSTFTGPTLIPVAAFTPLCNTETRGRCVQQPTSGSDLLESLGDRMMWRLVYRNFGDHSTLLASHSIVAGSSGGIRWYEIHNPETNPTVFQSGTFAPDSQFRWMPAIAMDQNQDIAVGFSRSGSASGQYPSVVYAGRTLADGLGTLESEVTLKAGLGSETGGVFRWGDYTSLAVDPVDDCTFWFTEEYENQTGTNNWSTAIGTFVFPGCGPAGGVMSLNPTSLKFGKVVVGVTAGKKKVTATNTGSSTLTISNIATTGDFGLVAVKQTKKITPCVNATNLAPGGSCLIKVSFTPTQKGARTGSVNFTDNAPGSPQSVSLTGTGK